MAKHRPLELRMSELQAQMASLQAQANKAEIDQHPEVVALDAEIDSLNKKALKWKRWQKDADKKVRDFQARVSEWESRGEEADAWLSEYKADLQDLKEKRNLVANEVAKGM